MDLDSFPEYCLRCLELKHDGELCRRSWDDELGWLYDEEDQCTS